MKIPGLIILFCTILHAWLIAQDFSSDFQLTISSDKTSYIEGESVWIKVEVTNQSASDRFIYDLTNDRILSGNFLDFTIKNSLDELIPYGRNRANDWPKITLKPNETVYNYFDLPNYYGNSITDPYIGRRLMPADTYQCTATLLFDTRVPGVVSDTISFTVRPTVGAEQAVFQNFIRGYEAWLIDFEDSRAVSIYEELIRQSPQSVFALLSAYYINKITLMSDELARDGIEESLDFVTRYPDSPFAYKAVKQAVISAYQYHRLKDLTARINPALSKMEPYFPGLTRLINDMIQQYQSE